MITLGDQGITLGDWGGIEPGPARGGSNWKVSGFPAVLVPAYSLLKHEQLQLAQASFRDNWFVSRVIIHLQMT